MSDDERERLKSLPWHLQLDAWEGAGVHLLTVRRGDSRHPVVFVERGGVRYAIKETTPHMAEREIRNLAEIERRGIPVLTTVGSVTVPAAPIRLQMAGIGGITQYESGDRGYTVTRLAPRVVPHVLLYRLPLTRRTKQRLLSAVAVLMIELHEHGVYWGDPSLANVLIRIDGHHILAIMADAETTELFPGPISEGLREQDLEQFGESLSWQAEDLRQAKGLPEDVQVLDDADYRYFRQRYRILRREHAHVTHTADLNAPLYYAQNFVQSVNELGSNIGTNIAERTGNAIKQVASHTPKWYQRRVYQLLHITIPRQYARRFYNLMLGHQAIMQKNQQRDVSLEEAAQDWYEYYHLPTILLLRQRLTHEQDPMQAYFAIMQHKWNMSMKAGYEIPLDEAILDWGVQTAQTGKLGPVDPASLATWWRQHEPITHVLEPALIESEELAPLLSTSERPLVKMQAPELDQKLPEILEKRAQNQASKEGKSETED